MSRYEWNSTRDKIICQALRYIGVLAEAGNMPQQAQIDEAAEVLNAMVKSWQTKGVFLWTPEWINRAIPVSNVVEGSDGLVYTCVRSHTSTLDDKPVSGRNWSSVWKPMGAEYGSVWDSGTRYVSSADFSLPPGTVGINKAFVRKAGMVDLPIQLVSREVYLDIINKGITSSPRIAFLDTRTDNPQMFLWPIPVDTEEVIHVNRVRMLEDMATGEDTPDFPVKWIRALTYGLAADLADMYQVPTDTKQTMYQKAEQLFLEAKGSDMEPSDATFAWGAYAV